MDDKQRLLSSLGDREIKVLLYDDPSFPKQLRRIKNGPSVLFVRGEIPLGNAVAIVGSRAASMAGIKWTHELAASLAAQKIVVISGGAIGIDTAAHQGALSVKEKTMAILGSGFNHIYPTRNIALFDEITRYGAVITPFSPDEKPLRYHFPLRNQLIAALAKVVVVVEAKNRSGALSTANWAKQLNIPVMSRPDSQGGIKLLSKGAGLVMTAEDVLGVLSGHKVQAFLPVPCDQDEAQVLAVLSAGQKTVDEVAAVLQVGVARTAALLLRMEINGLVLSLPGGRFEAVYKENQQGR